MAPCSLQDFRFSGIWPDLLRVEENANLRQLKLPTLNAIYSFWRKNACGNDVFKNEIDSNSRESPVCFKMESRFPVAPTRIATSLIEHVQRETESSGFRMYGTVDCDKLLKSVLLVFCSWR